MDPELKAYLDHISRDMSEMRREMKLEMGEMKREMMAHTEDVETRLLSEFWKWARTSDARYRQSHAVVEAMDHRVQAVEDRVAELERRRPS